MYLHNITEAIALGKAGVPLAMPSVAATPGETAVEAAAAIVKDYAQMHKMLASDWRGTLNENTNVTHWKAHNPMVFVASLDACSYDSVKKRHFLRHLYIEMYHFYQDRLGTNIGKTHKGRRFLRTRSCGGRHSHR